MAAGSCRCRSPLIIHGEQELLVVSCLYQTVAHGVHCLYRVHLADEVSQYPHSLERCLVVEQVVASCARLYEVYSREDTLVAQHAVELQFHVTRSLEFLEDYLVHL